MLAVRSFVAPSDFCLDLRTSAPTTAGRMPAPLYESIDVYVQINARIHGAEEEHYFLPLFLC